MFACLVCEVCRIGIALLGRVMEILYLDLMEQLRLVIQMEVSLLIMMDLYHSLLVEG